MPLPYGTSSRIDNLFIGADGQPTRHSVITVIVPTAPVPRYLHAFDFLGHCHVSASISEGSDDIRSLRAHGNTTITTFVVMLNPPAEPGERRVIGFDVDVEYKEISPAMFKLPVEPEGIAEWEISVCFLRDRLPKEVNSARWDGLGPASKLIESTVEPLTLQPLDELDPKSPYMIARIVRQNVPPDTTLGIFWKW